MSRTKSDQNSSGATEASAEVPASIASPRSPRLLFNVCICGMRPGVPVGVNLRLFADSEADARRKAAKMIDVFCDGVDLFKTWSRPEDTDSCRIYLDGDLMSKRADVYLEDVFYDD